MNGLISFVEVFEESLDAFEDAQLFTGPSVYFHRKATNLRRRFDSPSQAVAEDEFVDSTYATLAAWGCIGWDLAGPS